MMNVTDRFKRPSEDPPTALPAWHSRSVSEAVQRLAVDPSSGLSEAEAACRLATYGLNTIQERSSRRPLRILWDQFMDFMIMILIMAAVVSGFIGEPLDAAAIMVIVLLNGTVGFLQE
ncbi:MAG: cation-transporting P-type ATPase [Nitrospira sp.]|nr:cation-transporting P-type ATPase [Nitrospira sp.]